MCIAQAYSSGWEEQEALPGFEIHTAGKDGEPLTNNEKRTGLMVVCLLQTLLKIPDLKEAL